MTTKLIQELVGLCEKKNRASMIIEVREYDLEFSSTYKQKIIYLNEPDAPQQLQDAIERARQL
jgi:hypothetical protein